MEIGMVGLGRMGANMTERLVKGGHRVVGFDPKPEAPAEVRGVFRPIDTSVPGSASLIAEAVDELGYRRSDLRRILLTHFHEDHVGSAADITAWVTSPCTPMAQTHR